MKVLLIWMSVFIQRFFIVWCVLSLEKYATKKRDLGLLSKIDFGLGKCKKNESIWTHNHRILPLYETWG